MIRVGIIGTGNISGAHITGYLAHDAEATIVAMADVVPERPPAKAEQFGLTGVNYYDSALAMLEAENLDLVSVCTPPDQHAKLAIEALDHGVNVLVEKPMAPSLQECDAMLAAAERSGKMLSSVAQNRFRDDLLTLKEVLDSGLIGDVAHVQADSAWWRSLSYYDLDWRGRWDTEGGGCVLNHAIHHVDLLLWLLGSPSAVQAMLTNATHENSEVEDLSVATMKFGRALATLTASVVHHGEEQHVTIQGREARISQPWRVVAEQATPSGFPGAERNASLAAEIEALAAAHKPLAHQNHPGQIGDVLAALRDGRAPAISGHDGRAAIELVTAIYKAGIEGVAVELPLAPEDPYYVAGTLSGRAPRFYEKTGYLRDPGAGYIVGASTN